MVANGKYIIVIAPKGKTRHATLMTLAREEGPEQIGKTICGRPCGGWKIDGESSKDVKDCHRCSVKMQQND